MMKIVNLVNRPLTDAESQTINHFATLTGTECFACLASQVIAILPPLAEEHTEDLLGLLRERMAEINSGSDYSRFYMNDETLLVGLPNGICALSNDKSEGEPAMVMMLRHMVIDACAEGSILALVFNYD